MRRPTSKRTQFKTGLIAILAGLTIGAASPASAHDTKGYSDLSLDDPEEVLQQLIDLDADDIEELRDDMAEARSEIREAISEIDDAKEEARENPGGVVLNVALKTAGGVVSKTTTRAFAKIQSALSAAESDLAAAGATISDEERVETQLAIDTIRSELAEIELALDELVTAMRT